MRRFYSDEDVARWEKANEKSIAVHLEKLATELPQQKVDFHLSNLSGSYYLLGMTFIAKDEYKKAIDAFRASAQTRCKMYERLANGQGRELEAGHFQSLLVSFVTNDEALVSNFVGCFRAEKGTPDAVYIGKAIKLLASKEVGAAKIALTQKKPRFESQFVGYAECLEGIANYDEQRFVTALKFASESWAKWASKQMKGLPDSVCFIHGAGIVRLAEWVIGNRISVANECLPPQLLQ